MANYNSRGQEALLPYFAYDNQKGKGEIIYDNRHHNLAGTTAATDDPSRNYPLMLGTRFETEDGRVFRYVQMTGGAAALGTVLERAGAVAVDTVSSGSDLLTITKASAGWTAGAYAGDYAYIDESAAPAEEGQCRRILQNTTDTLYLDRPLTTALDVTDCDLTIIRPYRMIAATAAVTTPVSGVSAVGAITENYYGWIQVRGFCEHILLDDTASVAGQYLVVDDATAGTARGIGATVDVEDQRFFGLAGMANVSNTIPGDLIACILG